MTVALSSGESELYALGALSAELFFGQAIMKEIALSLLIHARADSSTARAVATETRSKSQDETHSHEILIHSRLGISETANDVISQVQRGTPRESDAASRREEACMLNPCNVVAQ